MSRGQKPASGRPPTKGVLYVLAGLLIASGVLRLGGEVAPAFATGLADPTSDTGASGAACPDNAEVAAMLDAFKAREARIAEKEAQIADRMQALSVAETQITERIAALQTARDQLASTLSVAQTASESDIAQLTTVYENMKPKDAAALFETMEPDFAAGFLSRMRPDAAAAIFAGLAPETAYSISAVIAGRNANVPNQ